MYKTKINISRKKRTKGRICLVSAGIGSIFRIFASQRLFVEHLSVTAGDQTWVVINAGDQTVAISGHGISRVGPETMVDRVLRDGRWALESNDGLRAAVVRGLVGPLASVDSVIVDQSGIAMFLVGLSVGALDVRGGTGVAILVDSKLVLAARGRQRSLIGGKLARTAVDGPVVVAVVMDGTLSVKQQTVFARLQRQRSVGAQEELVTVVGMQVGLLAVRLRALRNAGSTAKCSQSQAQD